DLLRHLPDAGVLLCDPVLYRSGTEPAPGWPASAGKGPAREASRARSCGTRIATAGDRWSAGCACNGNPGETGTWRWDEIVISPPSRTPAPHRCTTADTSTTAQPLGTVSARSHRSPCRELSADRVAVVCGSSHRPPYRGQRAGTAVAVWGNNRPDRAACR